MDDNQAQKEEKSTREKAREAVGRAQNAGENIQRGARYTRKGARVAARGGRILAQVVVRVAALAVEFWPITLIILGVILFIMVITSVVSILNSPPTSGGEASCSGNCVPSVGCMAPNVIDTDQTCPIASGQVQVCCVTPESCESIGGTCVANGSPCPSGTNQDSTGTCSDSTKPICCAPARAQGGFHFYCQYDSSYSNCNVTYYSNGTCSNNSCNGSTTCDIIRNGCTPTSIAMILASNGKDFNPRTTALARGGAGCLCGGSASTQFVTLVNGQGLHFISTVNLAYGNTFNVSLARQYIARGCYLTAAADMTYSEGGAGRTNGSGAHQTVIAEVNADGTVTDYDPTWCTSDTNYSARHFSVFDRSTIFSWYSVYPICP